MIPTLSVITPTLNVVDRLPGLIASLLAQTDRDFRFIVVDGASSDGTKRVIEEASDIVSVSISEPDHSLYDALNKAIRLVDTDYYLVVGADDILYPSAIANFRSVVRETGADVIVADVDIGTSTRRGYFPQRAWLGHSAMVTSHSVGMLFRTSLHKRFGEYSRVYPILADGLFIKRVCTAPDVKVAPANFVAGKFGLGGLSRTNMVRVLREHWQIQLETGENRFVQFLLFQVSLLRYLPRILRGDGSARARK